MLKPDDSVVVYMRPGCHVCARVKDYLTEHQVPYQARDVDRDPLTPRELWELFNRKADRLRVPFTALNDGEDVVLGYDPQRLEGVFVHGELGGVQVATAVEAPLVYDGFTSAELDRVLWTVAPDAGPPPYGAVDTGDGRLRIAGPVSVVSTRRFGTPPSSDVGFAIKLAVEILPDLHPPLGPPLAELSLRDLPTGMLLGFEVANDAILAVHRRAGLPGVSAPDEHFSHRVITDVSTAAGQSHAYRISYQHDTARARWYVDDRCVYTAVTPLHIEGVSLSMGLRGDPGVATWTPWHIAAG